MEKLLVEMGGECCSCVCGCRYSGQGGFTTEDNRDAIESGLDETHSQINMLIHTLEKNLCKFYFFLSIQSTKEF